MVSREKPTEDELHSDVLDELLRWASLWLNTLVLEKVSFRPLEAKLQRTWARKGMIQIIDLHDRIRVQRLQIELYNDIFLDPANWIEFGEVSKGKFARICVELDLEKPSESHIYERDYKLNLEYEGLDSICFHCGRFGH
ncbi:hypothetical protein HKD37_11G031549 [Glycine soja]